MRRSAGGSDVRAEVRAAVADVLGVAAEAVSTTVPLQEAGADSAGLVRVAGALGIPVWAVWQYPTVTALADYLAGTRDPRARPATRRSGAEPIAVVGLGCRLPGGIDSPARLWAAFLSGVDAIGPVPADRWDADEWFAEDVAAPGRTTIRRGGFLDDVAGFDAAFFRISPAEADRMDPQQRIALEVAWSALEDARVVPGDLAGSRAGVFFGTMWQEYHLATGADPASVGPQSAVGWDTSIVPARIAYALGLQGPAMSVGTACSSSLYAVHLAAHSLRRGESDLALAGGVHLMLHPHTTVAMTKFGGLNPAGQCRAFDADAAGYVRSEGCGVVVLRRLSDAVRAGDRIYAVLRGSAVNNDGASNGLTAPNPRAQVDVVRDAWQEAGVPTAEVSYVEAHGTGTALGDVIEAAALGDVFAPGRDVPLRIGSAKTNFGHLEPAAGVLGLLKTVLALHHGELPASLHFDRPNPKIDFVGQKLEVVTTRQAWPDGRYAGVSGFGYGGTNVHLALERAPYRPRRIVALAAPDAATLHRRIEDLLAKPAPVTGGTGPYRAFAAVDRWDELPAALRVESAGRPRRPTVFCFSGQGGQWVGMGRELLAEPAFRAALTEVEHALAPVVGWSVVDELVADAPRFDRTDVIQPVLFAIQVALARTLVGWGVVPEAVIGQSIGEVAAAVVAGALTVDEGARVIGRWSALAAERVDGTGTALVCELGADDATRLIGDRLDLAGELASDQVCLSGGVAEVAEVERELAATGVRTMRVAVGYPPHSAGLAPLAAELADLLADLAPTASAIPFVSTVTGTALSGTELDGAYWGRNVHLPMRILEAMRALPDGARIVEVGPHPVLAASLNRTPSSGADVLSTCRRDSPARQYLEDLLGTLWTDGVDVDWAAVRGRSAAGEQAVPWVLSARTAAGLRSQAAALHEHLGREFSPVDVGLSLATTRTDFEHRAVLLGEAPDELLDRLAALADGHEARGVVTGVAGDDAAGPVLVFPGQGAQWTGMARELVDTSPVFAERFAACVAALSEFVDWSPTQMLADEEALTREDVVQPLLWAVMVSLAELWQAHGVRPAAVVGHSQGEIAAACVAGALSLADGARVVALRSKVIARRIAGRGGLLSVALSREEAERYVTDRVTLAAENGPSATVFSGDSAVLDELLARCRADGVRARRVQIDYASHSAVVDTIRDELLDVLEPIQPRSGDVAFVSTVLGEPLDTAGLDAEYWYRNLRSPVQFRTAIERLAAAGHRVFIEVSAHPVLTMGIQATAPDLAAIGSLRRDDGGLTRFHTSLAEAHVRGVRVDWTAALPALSRVVDLPTYRFQRERHWLDVVRPAPHMNRVADEFWSAVGRGDVAALATTLGVAADTTLAGLLPALRGWHGRTHGADALRDWRYEIAWRPVDEPAPSPTGSWLALVPASAGRSAEVLAGLAGEGMVLVPVPCAPDRSRYRLATACADAAAQHDVVGVLSLLALDPDAHPTYPDVPAGYAATVLAVQALGKAGLDVPLWCVTSGAVATGPADRIVRPEQRLVWGLGRVAALEHPGRWGGLVDLPAGLGDESGAGLWPKLVSALHRGDGEDQLAVRSAGTLVRRLARTKDLPAAERWRPSGTVLVTGGTGALGGHVARWLAERGAGRLVLTSRRGPDAPGAAELATALRGLGADVDIMACDVADRGALRSLLSGVGPVTAVVHAAAVLDDAMLDTLDVGQIAESLRAKVRGAWNLHELTADTELSAFVLLSSVSATVGLPGQGNYAPANAYLDGLAELRRAAGLPVTAVSFGAWAGDGMASTAAAGVLDRYGLSGMDPVLAVRSLQHAIDAGRAGQTVADVRWDRFVPMFTAARPSRLLADLPEARALVSHAPADELDLRARLAALPAGRRSSLMLDVVLRHIAAVLGYRDRPDSGRPLRELGFDSVTGVDLRNRLSAATGFELPVTMVFEHSTANALTAYLLIELGVGDVPPSPEPPSDDLFAEASDDELFEFIDTITIGRRTS